MTWIDRLLGRSPASVPIDLSALGTQLKAASDPAASIQGRFHSDDEVFAFMSRMSTLDDDLPAVGTEARDKILRDIWKVEPILAGAVSSMAQKMVALNWSVTGGRNKVRRAADILYNAEDGAGWNVYFSKVVQDYLTQDKGTFTEKATEYPGGPVIDIYQVDSARVRLTGVRDYPFEYMDSVSGTLRRIPRDAFFHLSSLPSPQETAFNTGFCAVSRAIKSAKTLLALYKYDSEKLADMPPNGIATVTGMTNRQVREAIRMYKEEREKNNSLTFPGVLWLASSVGDVKVTMVPFSTLPEQFDREVIVTLYVYTLALDFGVDAREFWPATVTGATKADALIQAQKAKGKGPGELITALERAINFHVIPEGCTFEFDFSDDEEDRLGAEIAGMKIRNAGELVQSGLLLPEEARAWLVSQRVLPEVFAAPAVEGSLDIEGHKSFLALNPETTEYRITRKGGSIKEVPLLVAPYNHKPKVLANSKVDEVTIEVTSDVAKAIANGSELVISEGSIVPQDNTIVRIVAEGYLYARGVLQEARFVDGVYVGVFRTMERFSTPIPNP